DPDVTFTTPLYTVPTINDDLYKCFVIQTNFAEDKYISDIEIFPNNRNIVHHILAYQNLTNDPVIADNNDPALGFECGGSLEGGNNVLVAEWVPGARAWTLPEGTGIKLTAGANIVIQVHYPDNADGQNDFLTMNMKFEDNSAGDVREVFQDQTLDHLEHLQQSFLFIPANTTPTFTQKFVLPEDRTFIGTAPHAHLLCQEMKSWAIKPDGTTVNMVHIPNWDFDWQGFYYYPEPIILPAGTELWGEARYDNTSNNPKNPNNPPQLVTLGEDTDDEMMLFFYQYLFYENGDETLFNFTEEHDNQHTDECNSLVPVFDIEKEQKFSISPNPNQGNILSIEWGTKIQGNYILQIMDVTGKQIFESSCSSNCDVNLPTFLENGVYLCSISQEGNAIGRVEKLVIMK
ncbi:MAG: T9SS type A sorting domain-containing protein, partial [Saprospiraceae bacterium]